MTPTDRIKSLCKQQKKSISTLEKDLGYGNGYISGLKNGMPKMDRIIEIAKYLDVPVTYITTGSDVTDEYDDVYADIIGKMRQYPEERKAIRKLFDLPESVRGHIIDLINDLSEV